MKLSVKSFKKRLLNRTSVLFIAAILLAPFVASAQSDDDLEQPTATEATGSGPWGNSAGSTIGTRENSSTVGAATPAYPSAAGGTAARPAAGPTVDATGGPGGNPDVPFDSNMNLLFLLAGVGFAYMVYRRRLTLKAVPANKA